MFYFIILQKKNHVDHIPALFIDIIIFKNFIYLLR